jgi:hypothetical protein
MNRHSDHEFIATMSLAVGLALAGCAGEAPTPDAVPQAAVTRTPPPPGPAPAATGPDRASGQFARMDRDADAMVTVAEHEADAQAMFATMDADGDGNVTAAEMDASQPALDGDARMTSAEKIAVIDADADGVLSATEHAAGASAMFVRMDTDHDLLLTEAELQAGHDAILGAGGTPVDELP